MKLFTKPALVLLLGLLLAGVAAPAQAQVNINIQTPGWGPAVRSNAQYYYIPEIDAYYDLYDRSYVYFDGLNWLRSYQLPVVYQGYDPYQFHPVVIDYIGAQPWGYIRDHRLRYRSGYAYSQPRRVVVAQPYRGGYYNAPRTQYREQYNRGNYGNYGGGYNNRRPDYDRDRDHDRGNNGNRRDYDNGYGRDNGNDRGNGNNGNGRGNNEGRNSQSRYGRGR